MKNKLLFLILGCLYLNNQVTIAANITFQPIYFSPKASELTKAAKEALERVAQLLQSNPETKLQLIGHAGEEGEGIETQALSEQRAKTAMNYLIEKYKVVQERVSWTGKGTSHLQRPENPKAAENRRVEFVFSSSSPQGSTVNKGN